MRDRIINIVAFAVFSILWLGFLAALVISPEMLSNIWLSLRGLPLIIQGLVWLLALPVVLGLWIWQTAWPIAIRLVLVFGLAWVTVYTFFPRKAITQTGVLPSSSN